MKTNLCKGSTNGCLIVGSLLLVLAIVLTFLTHSDAGIFGMFLAGIAFCASRKFGCKTCSCCGCCSCCCKCDCCEPHDMSCSVPKKATRKK